jgi:uncharacterized metal-binding protein YceD (DUF177 family)
VRRVCAALKSAEKCIGSRFGIEKIKTITIVTITIHIPPQGSTPIHRESDNHFSLHITPMTNTLNLKVSDLLHDIGQHDSIHLQDIKLRDIDHAEDGEIQGSVILESISDARIHAEFQDLECLVNDQCDTCSKSFIRPIRVDSYECTFASANGTDPNEAGDEVFAIDTKDNISLEAPLRQAILLGEPMVKKCFDCINQSQNNDDTEDERHHDEYSEDGGTINFHK